MNFFQKSAAFLATSFLVGGLHAQYQSLPTMVIKTIKNTTPYDLIFTDRFNHKSLILEANTATHISFEIIGSQRITLNGSLGAILADKAQFVIKKLDATGAVEADKESYINIHVGGQDEQSNFKTGKAGSVQFQFLMANKSGGCQLSLTGLKNPACTLLEIDLELTTEKQHVYNNVFKLCGEWALTEK